VQYEVL
jgi:hypothetical protein